MMFSSIISNIIQLLIFLLFVNIILGLYVTSDDNQQYDQLLKRRSAENDNEYVWFTRDIHNDINNEEIKKDQLQKQPNLFRYRIFNDILNRKYPFVKNTMYQSK